MRCKDCDIEGESENICDRCGLCEECCHEAGGHSL